MRIDKLRSAYNTKARGYIVPPQYVLPDDWRLASYADGAPQMVDPKPAPARPKTPPRLGLTVRTYYIDPRAAVPTVARVACVLSRMDGRPQVAHDAKNFRISAEKTCTAGLRSRWM